MAPTTQLAFADVLGLDVCGVVDSFRPMRAFRAPVDQRRAELNLAKRRWIALFKKEKRHGASMFGFRRIQVRATYSAVGLWGAMCPQPWFPGADSFDAANQWLHARYASVLFDEFRLHHHT